MENTTEENKKRGNGRLWIIVLLILLLGLSALFLIDRFRTHKQLLKLSYEKDTAATVNKSLKEQLANTDKQYSDLLAKYNTLMDTTISQSGILEAKKKELLELQALLNKQDSIVNAINKVIKDALLGFNADELKIETKNGKLYITMLDKLLFESGKAEVQVKGNDALKKIAEVLNKNKDIKIEIEGHTDNVPIKNDKFKDNWDLSVARATAVVRILTQSHSVDAKRVTASGRGEFYPVETNDTQDGKAKNRRTEIILTPDLGELYKLLNNKAVSK